MTLDLLTHTEQSLNHLDSTLVKDTPFVNYSFLRQSYKLFLSADFFFALAKKCCFTLETFSYMYLLSPSHFLFRLTFLATQFFKEGFVVGPLRWAVSIGTT